MKQHPTGAPSGARHGRCLHFLKSRWAQVGRSLRSSIDDSRIVWLSACHPTVGSGPKVRRINLQGGLGWFPPRWRGYEAAARPLSHIDACYWPWVKARCLAIWWFRPWLNLLRTMSRWYLILSATYGCMWSPGDLPAAPRPTTPPWRGVVFFVHQSWLKTGTERGQKRCEQGMIFE